MNKNNLKVKQVRWRDSKLYITQEEKEIDWSICIIESIGFLVKEDKDKIVLAGDIVEGDVRRVIVIPRENIMKEITR